MIKAIIFDYDGVIVDSFPKFHEVYMFLCEGMGKSCPSDLDEFRRVYGRHSKECHRNLGLSAEESAELYKSFAEEIMKRNIPLFEGIPDVIRELHGSYKLAVISSSFRDDVVKKLRGFGLDRYFEFIIGREGYIERLNKTESFKKALIEFGVENGEVLLIGDRNVDFNEGTKAGLENILLVDYGWGYDLSEIPNYEKKVAVKEPRDILEAVKNF